MSASSTSDLLVAAARPEVSDWMPRLAEEATEEVPGGQGSSEADGGVS